jgi:hypothetical protein
MPVSQVDGVLDYERVFERRVLDLYRVRGIAPTYTNKSIGGVFENLTMNWWVYRRRAFAIDYSTAFTGTYEYKHIKALSQLFLLDEAEMFKRWIDAIYPEENTEILQVGFPIEPFEPYPYDYDEEKKQGSFWSNPPDYDFDLAVCYYIDTNNVKVRAIQ